MACGRITSRLKDCFQNKFEFKSNLKSIAQLEISLVGRFFGSICDIPAVDLLRQLVLTGAFCHFIFIRSLQRRKPVQVSASQRNVRTKSENNGKLNYINHKLDLKLQCSSSCPRCFKPDKFVIISFVYTVIFWPSVHT